MPKPTLSTTVAATVEAKVDVRLKATTKAMIKARCEEYASLATEVKSRTARQERIRKEVKELFAADGQLDALQAGTDIDGFRVKEIGGSTTTFDFNELMRVLDLMPSDLLAFQIKKPKKAHVKISAPGEQRDDG